MKSSRHREGVSVTFSSISGSGLEEGWGEKTEVPAKEEEKRLSKAGAQAQKKRQTRGRRAQRRGKWPVTYWKAGQKTANLLAAVIFTATSKSLKLSFIK